jgi:GNAT superfamily N-acetyltransferase
MSKIKIQNNPSEDDLKEWLKIIKHVWPANTKTYEELLWSFSRPYKKCPVYQARFDDDLETIIGTRGAWHVDLVFKNETYKGLQVGDTCVHPGARRLGVLTKMSSSLLKEAALQGYNFIYNISVDIARKANEKIGWKYHDGFNLYLRPAGLVGLLKFILKIKHFKEEKEFKSSEADFISKTDIENMVSIIESAKNDFYCKITVKKRF